MLHLFSGSTGLSQVLCLTISNQVTWIAIFGPGPLAQSDSRRRGFDPRSGHIGFAEISSRNNLYGHSLPTADSRRAHSYWRKYGQLVLVNRLGSLSRNSVDLNSDWAVKPQNNNIVR